MDWSEITAWLAEHGLELVLGLGVLGLGIQANRATQSSTRLALLQATPISFTSTVEFRYVLNKPRATIASLTVTNFGGAAAAVKQCRIVSGRTTCYLRPVAVQQATGYEQRNGMNAWGDFSPLEDPAVEGGRAERLHFAYDAPEHAPERLEAKMGDQQSTLVLEIVGGPSAEVDIQVTGPGSSRQKTRPSAEDSPYALAQKWHERLLPPTAIGRARKRARVFLERLRVHREFRRYLGARKQAGFSDPPPPSWWFVIWNRK